MDPESWLFLPDGLAEGGRAFVDFDAMAGVGRFTGGWGHGLRLLRLIPGPLSRWLYRRVARNRHALFGRGDICAVPDAAFRARLIG